jgi:hypothetical protein
MGAALGPRRSISFWGISNIFYMDVQYRRH